MIIFYSKETGMIQGTVDGRIHSEDHLKMWIGDPKETDRIVVQWKPTGKETITIIEDPIYEEYVDTEGFIERKQVGVKKRKERSADFEPDHPQKDIFMEFDKNSSKIYNYKVDTTTKSLVKK